ncbi:MAG: hypothetical protein ACOVO2_14045 [Emticicia sp.]|uniref:hypothetical protein n=1 Tax=Emticicia sp. TaxID=1930953 RepID=UPI003BA64E85
MKTIYNEMTLQELKKQEKTVKTVRSIFIGLSILLIASSIFLITKEGFSTISVVPIIFLPMYVLIHFLSARNLKNIQAAIIKKQSK